MDTELLSFINHIKQKGSVLGLSNMYDLMERLGNVQNALPIIHIAGTNGKGSVGCYLAAMLKAAGYTVGRYVSPAVFSPLEEFTIDGEMISVEDYDSLMEEIRLCCKGLAVEKEPTFFEAETALAFLWFARQKPDFVLMECGMGGAEDATNVFDKPFASVITSISLDHTAILGKTVEEIAAVKAGIIKPGCPVYSAGQTPSVRRVLAEAAEKQQAPITFAKEENLSLVSEEVGRLVFNYRRGNLSYGLETRMAGYYQMSNAALALECFLGICPDVADKNKAILDGIGQAYWPGRFEVVSRQPLILLDGAHNEDAAFRLEQTLQHCFPGEKIGLIMGVLADKDHRRMLETLLPHAAYLVTLTPENNPRALDGRELLAEAKELAPSLAMECGKNYRQALQKALNHGKPILACGSLSYLGGLKEEIKRLQTEGLKEKS